MHYTCLEMRLTQSQSGILAALVCKVTYNYPIIILNVDISFLLNKVIQHFDLGTFSYHV